MKNVCKGEDCIPYYQNKYCEYMGCKAKVNKTKCLYLSDKKLEIINEIPNIDGSYFQSVFTHEVNEYINLRNLRNYSPENFEYVGFKSFKSDSSSVTYESCMGDVGIMIEILKKIKLYIININYKIKED